MNLANQGKLLGCVVWTVFCVHTCTVQAVKAHSQCSVYTPVHLYSTGHAGLCSVDSVLCTHLYTYTVQVCTHLYSTAVFCVHTCTPVQYRP